MKNKLKIDYTGYKKICTVLGGRGLVFVGYFFTVSTFIVGLFVLPDDIAFGIWLFTAVGIAITVYYSLNCSKYIYLGNDGIYFKEKKYEWTNLYVTLYAPGPSLLRNCWQYNAYFGDHYLSEEEINTREKRKEGFYLELGVRRVKTLLAFYNKRVKIANHSIAINGKSVLKAVLKHNQDIADVADD